MHVDEVSMVHASKGIISPELEDKNNSVPETIFSENILAGPFLGPC